MLIDKFITPDMHAIEQRAILKFRAIVLKFLLIQEIICICILFIFLNSFSKDIANNVNQ